MRRKRSPAWVPPPAPSSPFRDPHPVSREVDRPTYRPQDPDQCGLFGWQKTALARACMRPQPLLLVLDAPSEHTIFERYMARARGLAESTGAITVVISHRFSTVTGADLILVLDGGRLIEQGSHEETCGGGRPHGARRAVAAQAVIVLLCQKQVGVRLKNGSKFGFLRRF